MPVSRDGGSLDPGAVFEANRLPQASAYEGGIPTNGNPEGPQGDGGGVDMAPQHEPTPQPMQPAVPERLDTHPPAQSPQVMQIGEGRDADPAAPPQMTPAQTQVAAVQAQQAAQVKPEHIPLSVYERERDRRQALQAEVEQARAREAQLQDYYSRVEPMRQAWNAKWPEIQGLEGKYEAARQELDLEKATNAYIQASYAKGELPDVDGFVRQRRTDQVLQQAASLPQTVQQIVQQQLNGILDNRDQNWQQQQQQQTEYAEQQRRQEVVTRFEAEWQQIEMSNASIAGNDGWKQAAFLQWAQAGGVRPVAEVMSPYLRGLQSQQVAAQAAQMTRPEMVAQTPRTLSGGSGSNGSNQQTNSNRPPIEVIRGGVRAISAWNQQRLRQASGR